MNDEMILDSGKALFNIGGDKELYAEITAIFMSETPLLIDKFREAVIQNDLTSATRHAHSLKSTSLTVGAIRLGERAKELESATAGGDSFDVEKTHAILIEEFVLVKEALAKLLH